MRRFCEDVNHFTKHLVQLIMANKNHLNLPVSVGVFLSFDDFTQPAVQPRVDGDDRSAWAPDDVARRHGSRNGSAQRHVFDTSKKTWLHQGDMCRNIIFRGAGLAWTVLNICHEQWKKSIWMVGNKVLKEKSHSGGFIMIYHKGICRLLMFGNSKTGIFHPKWWYASYGRKDQTSPLNHGNNQTWGFLQPHPPNKLSQLIHLANTTKFVLLTSCVFHVTLHFEKSEPVRIATAKLQDVTNTFIYLSGDSEDSDKETTWSRKCRGVPVSTSMCSVYRTTFSRVSVKKSVWMVGNKVLKEKSHPGGFIMIYHTGICFLLWFKLEIVKQKSFSKLVICILW